MDNSVQIIPYYAHPHVHTVIIDDSFYDETVASPRDPSDLPFATVVVAGADKGIDNTFVRVSDLNTKKALFGQGNFQKYGQPSLQADLLFNGSTNVWFCRVLPDNATYANLILLANYRMGDERDDLDQETGLKRMEIKFSVAYATKPALTEGATSDDIIHEYANTLIAEAAADGDYNVLPICYIRATGRGRYGNQYSMSFRRDTDAEKEYGMKMYKWSLITNAAVSRITNIFSGSLYQATRYNQSTLVSDVLDQFPTGSCPVYIYPFEDNFVKLYEFYKKVVDANAEYLEGVSASDEQLATLREAMDIDTTTFDPLFGYTLNARTDLTIPYYKNYTEKASGPYVAPNLQVGNAAEIPQNVSEWNTAEVGMTLLVEADENQGGSRWQYTITAIDAESGNITYDEGVECSIDDPEYDGLDISKVAGVAFSGGHDGDFEEISVDGETRAPTNAEMKLLLAREYVKAFRGEKDRKILSPARMNLDFIFDANYNMTSDDDLALDGSIQSLYSNSTVLTDADYNELSVNVSNGYIADLTDLNVKKAMYDLNEFRNRNGMTVNEDMGAGCSLHLDCGLTRVKSQNPSNEIKDVLNMFEGYTGRATSVDLGCYDIFDPYTGKRISVTVTYFLAQKLIPHLMANGLNKPFTYSFAQLTAIQRNTALTGANSMIRDSFKPDIDLIDWDAKEMLYNGRVNYYITRDEGRIVQRACQNTRQMDASALLEENNVRVLNTLKKGLEAACRGYLYNWNEPEVRKGYTDSQMAIYRPWIGTMVQDIEIKFTANEWEEERMIMHCYCVVKFRNIIKRIILEINIQRPEYSGGES